MPRVNAFLEAPRPGVGIGVEPSFPLDLYFCERCTLVQLHPVVDPALQSRRDHRRLPRNPGTLDHRSHPVEERQSICIQHDFDTNPPKPCNPIRPPRINRLDVSTPPRKKPSHGLPRPSQSHDQIWTLRKLRPELPGRRRTHQR